MQCLCGCGEEATHGRWKFGHGKSPQVDRFCACGCGGVVRSTSTWLKGHCNRKPKPIGQPCVCGCGGMAAAGHRFLSGHNSRMPEERERRSQTFDRLWAEGKFKDRRVWSKGLTKETDERLKENGQKVSSTYTPEKRLKFAEMASGGVTGFYKRGFGPDSPHWKGGITKLAALARGSKRLYQEWKFPILQDAGFRCPCGSRKTLHIHHDAEPFIDILRRFLGDRDPDALSWDEKCRLADEIVEHHISAKVSGACLCEACHRLAHTRKPDID